MTLSPDFFRRDAHLANTLIDGPHGSVLRIVAQATAATRPAMIGGYLIFSGPDLVLHSRRPATSRFVVDPSYEAQYRRDPSNNLFEDLADFLARFAITGTYHRTEDMRLIHDACQELNIEFFAPEFGRCAQEVFAVFAGERNEIDFSLFILLVRSNYFRVMQALVMNEYLIDGYAVIPNVILQPFGTVSQGDLMRARLRTRSERRRRAALAEVQAIP